MLMKNCMNLLIRYGQYAQRHQSMNRIGMLSHHKK
jgi:hypothetical protein